MKEIFFHYSEFKGDLEALQAGDDVEFTIKDRNVGVVKLLTSSLHMSATHIYMSDFSNLDRCTFSTS